MAGQTPIYGLPYQTLTDPPHGPDLGRLLAEAVEGELARIDTPAGPWTDFSASALVSAPGGYAKGLTSYSARYQRNGKVTNYGFTISINTGGGFAPGAGPWSFLLPVTAQGLNGVGSVWVNDSGTALRVGSLILASTTTAQAYLYNVPGNALDSNGPGTAWATGDVIRGFITYEAA